MTGEAFRKLALSMPGAFEAPHFDRTSFRAGKKKKIFATMTADGTEAMIPVLPVERCLAMLASNPELFIDHKGFTRAFGSLGLRLKKVDAKLVAAMLGESFERSVATPRSKKTRPAR
jgi:hypothetical protein